MPENEKHMVKVKHFKGPTENAERKRTVRWRWMAKQTIQKKWTLRKTRVTTRFEDFKNMDEDSRKDRTEKVLALIEQKENDLLSEHKKLTTSLQNCRVWRTRCHRTGKNRRNSVTGTNLPEEGLTNYTKKWRTMGGKPRKKHRTKKIWRLLTLCSRNDATSEGDGGDFDSPGKREETTNKPSATKEHNYSNNLVAALRNVCMGGVARWQGTEQ